MSWNSSKLGDLLAKVIDNRGKTPPLASDGIELLETNSLAVGNKFPDYQLVRKHVSKDVFESWFRTGHPQKGDILISTVGSIGCVAIMNEARGCVAQNLVGLRSNARIDPDFLYYFLSWSRTQHELKQMDIGVAQPSLKVPHLLNIQVKYPSLPMQHRIGSILSAYDDLIENNTRRIKILEQMTQMLYREWFVNFRFPGHEKVKMVESEIGLIPEGWPLKKLGDVLRLDYGKALKADQRTGGSIPVFGSSGVVGFHSESLTSGPGVIVGRKGNVGSVFYCHSDFWVIDTAYFVSTSMPLHFVFFNLCTQNFLNNDAAVPGLNRNQAHSLPIVVPDEKTLASFEKVAKPMFELKNALEKKNKNLRATRDLLLPKLVSGEIEIPVAENVLEGATV